MKNAKDNRGQEDSSCIKCYYKKCQIENCGCWQCYQNAKYKIRNGKYKNPNTKHNRGAEDGSAIKMPAEDEAAIAAHCQQCPSLQR